MGFFDNYEDTGGASYIKKEEKAVLIADATPLTVTRVFTRVSRFLDENKQPRQEYVVVTELDGEERAITFGAGSVESRDRMLDAIIAYLDGEDDDPVAFVMKKVGAAVVLVDPEKASQ